MTGKEKVLLCVSGGVDSGVGAYLLKSSGYDVTCLFLDMISGKGGRSALESARQITGRLALPLHVIDVRQEFRARVVDYFIDTYAAGRTPNPCVVCNRRLKIAMALKVADSLGIQLVATGHYARVVKDDQGPPRLHRGLDPGKDQSYFLQWLRPSDLKRMTLPLGERYKKEVKQIARRIGILDMVAKESQEVCFLSGDYRVFLRHHLPKLTLKGPIVDTRGRLLGHHNGLYAYTVGQRKGLGLTDTTPYYVVALEPSSNTLVVGKCEDLLSSCAQIEEINWLTHQETMNGVEVTGTDVNGGEAFKEWLQQHKEGKVTKTRVVTKLRYNHPGVPATLFHCRRSGFLLFDTPQRAVTPGQFASIQINDLIVGGGIICA